MGGYINGAPFLTTFNNPSQSVISTVVAIYEIGGFFGSIFTSFVGEIYGRRQMTAMGAICLIVGAIIQASSFELGQLIVGRIVSGCGVGILQSTLGIFQAEMAPKDVRGMFGTAYITFLCFGNCVAYWLK